MSSLKCIVTVFAIFLSCSCGMNNFADISCGKRSAQPGGRIVGGTEAGPHEFPWLVSITRRGGHFCGGSLITNQHVLTAGHCLCTGVDDEILQPGSFKVTMAQHDLSSSTSANSYEMAVRSVSVHPEYSCRKARNDVAVVVLASKLHWSNFVLPACLPTANGESDYTRFDNILATVAGWGWTSENNAVGQRATVLRKAKVNILENETCRAWYKSQGKKAKIQDTQLCAGFEQGGVDSCWADSGGPLMVKSGDRMMVVGVVSTGIGCARPSLPGLYTRISDYIPWIKSVLQR